MGEPYSLSGTFSISNLPSTNPCYSSTDNSLLQNTTNSELCHDSSANTQDPYQGQQAQTCTQLSTPEQSQVSQSSATKTKPCIAPLITHKIDEIIILLL